MTLSYKAAGLIYESMLAGSISNLQVQWAIRGLFSENARENHAFGFYDGAATEAAFLALAQNPPNSAYAGLVLYTPLGAQPGCGPEEFIGYTPVPETSLMLLGTGLLARDGDLMKLFEFKLTHSQDAPATLADVKTRCGRFRAALN